MNKKLSLELVEITQTCYACPSQWDARSTDNEYIYIRYRFGGLSVEKILILDDETWERDLLFYEDIGGRWAGDMTTEEMLQHTGLKIKESK
ncbi:MAG TPA: hypothetical protein VGD26_03400 [Chitinophagaceae bacterium]